MRFNQFELIESHWILSIYLGLPRPGPGAKLGLDWVHGPGAGPRWPWVGPRKFGPGIGALWGIPGVWTPGLTRGHGYCPLKAPTLILGLELDLHSTREFRSSLWTRRVLGWFVHLTSTRVQSECVHSSSSDQVGGPFLHPASLESRLLAWTCWVPAELVNLPPTQVH